MLHVYKSRLYRLDGQQNRLDLYHVQLNPLRWSALTRFYENQLDLCHIRLDCPSTLIIRGSCMESVDWSTGRA